VAKKGVPWKKKKHASFIKIESDVVDRSERRDDAIPHREPDLHVEGISRGGGEGGLGLSLSIVPRMRWGRDGEAMVHYWAPVRRRW